MLSISLSHFIQDPDAPFPHVYGAIGWTEVKWIVSIGAVFALCTSLLGAMFPLPRVLYAMAEDGILYKVLKRVHPKTKTPVIATILSGLFAAIMALIFNLQQLVDMMSIGTLLAYTIVAICVLVLRYQHEIDYTTKELEVTFPQIVRQLVNANLIKRPNSLSAIISKLIVVIFCFVSIVLCTLLNALEHSTKTVTTSITALLIPLIVTLGILVLLILILARQPTSEVELTFKVPLVPFLPCLSIVINLYLMFQLDMHTWIRFIVWIIIGYVIYFTYGIQNSVQGKHENNARGTLDNANNMHSMQNVNMDFVTVSTLALTDTNMKSSKF